jgi:hypothetical protein
VLLQITTLGPTDRGGGLGSLLRNAVLNMLPDQVLYALTTTPVDGTKTESIDPDDPSTYSPAMRFHARGGANPARILPGYKTPEDPNVETSHGRDIVVMRYARDAEGVWPAKRPPMRVRSLGPLQERILRTGRSLRMRGLKAPRPHLPSVHAPHVSVPGLHASAQIRALKTRAGRLRHRNDDGRTSAPPSESPAPDGATI